MNRPVGVVLASGRGRRLGGPKALLYWPYLADGRFTLAELHARALLHAGCARVLIVTRADIAAVLRPRLPSAAQLIVSREPDADGPAGSLRAGWRALSSSDRSVLITPVDALPLRADVYAQLSAAQRRAGRVAARPRFRGRGGHPVVLASEALRAFAVPGAITLRALLRALGPACAEVAVLDPASAQDIDTPADWQQLALRMGRDVVPPLRFAPG